MFTESGRVGARRIALALIHYLAARRSDKDTARSTLTAEHKNKVVAMNTPSPLSRPSSTLFDPTTGIKRYCVLSWLVHALSDNNIIVAQWPASPNGSWCAQHIWKEILQFLEAFKLFYEEVVPVSG